MWEFCLRAGDKSNKYDGEYFRKCCELLPRNWSVPSDLGKIIYKFEFKCGDGFQLVDTSDFGISLQAITYLLTP